MENFKVISNNDNERNKKLFINTVEQFKKDLIFLQGCVAISVLEKKNLGDLSDESLVFIQDHLHEMLSMLNDFNSRMNDAQNI